MIKLYFYKMDSVAENASLGSRAERNKLISHTAYTLLKDKVSKLCGKPIEIKKEETGRPYIDCGEYEISISHTDNALLLAVSDKRIGVDLECPRIFSDHMKERLFTERERGYISLGDESLFSTVLWTMREAVCKSVGEGFSDWFFNCEMVDDSLKPLTKYTRNGILLNLKTYFIDGYVITVAAVSDTDNVELNCCDL